MRKLEEHFCTFEQSEKLAELGLKHFAALLYWNKENGDLKLGNSGLFTVCRAPLRSQALDFFRDKRWEFSIKCLNKMYWYEIYIGDSISFDENITEEGLFDYHVSENALIDKLIELEMEAQHGK